MKRLLNVMDYSIRVFFIVLAFLFATSFAEVESKGDSAARAVSDLQNILSESFDYYDVYYFEELDRIMVRVAVDGLADLVNGLIEAGYDETFEGWAEYRSNIITMYDALLEYVQSNHRDDLTISFHLVSDEDIRNGKSVISSHDFISIIGGTKSVFDILKFQSTVMQK